MIEAQNPYSKIGQRLTSPFRAIHKQEKGTNDEEGRKNKHNENSPAETNIRKETKFNKQIQNKVP